MISSHMLHAPSTSVRFSNKVAVGKLMEMYLKLTVIFDHQHSVSCPWSIVRLQENEDRTLRKQPRSHLLSKSAGAGPLTLGQADAHQHGSYWREQQRQTHHHTVFNDDCRWLWVKASHSSLNVWAPNSKTVLTTGIMATAAKQMAMSPRGAWLYYLKRSAISP